MEALKNLSFTLALLLIGAIFILLGLAGGVTFGEMKVVVAPDSIRWVTAIFGGILVGSGLLLEYRPRSRQQDPQHEDRPQGNSRDDTEERAGPTAEQFFYTLDDTCGESFPVLVESASRVSILCRTAVNLLAQYSRTFEDLCERGCQVRLLFVDPTSDACRHLYGNRPDVFVRNAALAEGHLRHLAKKAKDHLEVRLMQAAPTLSLIIIEKAEAADSVIVAQLYFLHSAIGRDRPIFRVNRSDRWFSILIDEFTSIWTHSRKWSPSNGAQDK